MKLMMAIWHQNMNSCRLFKFAVFIRVFVILLQLLFNIVPDHNADAFRLPYESEGGSANSFISNSLSGFSRWDAQYFMHVSLYGYTHENTLAFFPLFPLMLRFASTFVSLFLSPLLSDLNCTLLAGVLLNLFLSSLASICLYKLTLSIFHSEIYAFISSLLYIINPASIFFSALYSEALFSFFTFSGLWILETGNKWLALCLLSLSAAVRSNGVISLGFIFYAILKDHVRDKYKMISFSPVSRMILLLKTLIKMVLSMILFSVPFMLYQAYCYALYCTSVLPEPDIPDVVLDFVTRNDLKMPSEPSKWCFKSLPIAYTYVQSRYWNVGFLHYFTFKQIPNFLLACPIAMLVIFPAIKYFNRNKRKLWHAGLLTYQSDNVSDIYSCSRCFPYFVYATAVTIFCILFIHVQVLTRILSSSSPVIYWVASASLLPSNERSRFKLMKDHSRSTWLRDCSCFLKNLFSKAPICGKIVFSYFVSYFLIGTFLHVNFLPWT